MDVSVIICTRNRAASLLETLRALSLLKSESGLATELLIVDNGSTDHTRSVVTEYKHPYFPINYLFVPAPGKGNAYNMAFQHSKGEILLFTDDDVRPPVDWIDRMCKPIKEGKADAVAGGVVFPPHIDAAMETEPLRHLKNWWASTSGLDATNPHTMVGANMAFHRRILERVPAIDPELGPGALGFGEEALFSRQLREAGFRLAPAFDVTVEHHFDQSRLTRDGVLDAARKMGRSHAFVFYHWYHHRSRAVLFRLIHAMVRRLACSVRETIGKSGPIGLSLKRVQAERDIAFCREYMNQARRPRKYARNGLVPLTD